MRPYDAHWRQALNDHAPTATDADWAAMRKQFPSGKPSRTGRTRWWLGALLLVLVGAGTQVQWTKEEAVLPDTHQETTPHATEPSPTMSTDDRLLTLPINRLPTPVLPLPVDSTISRLPKDLDPIVVGPTRPERAFIIQPLPPDRPVHLKPSTYIPVQMQSLGKSLIVVPPAQTVPVPASDNGFYPPVRSRNN